MREVGADGQVIDARQLDLVASHREVVVAEKGGERLQVVAIRRDRIGRNVPLVRQVIEEIADLVLHAQPIPRTA